MNFIKKSIFIILVSFFFGFSAKAEVNVVTTIKPLHSLVSSVMKGVGEPSLIIEGTNNPHTFVFKPSHAKMIEEADIIFWIGEDLEAFMEKPLDSLAEKAQVISFMELSSIEKLKFREKNIFDDHDGHEDEHEGHDDDHNDAHAHAHGEFDAHIWLDPVNAKKMVLEIAHELSDLDPNNKVKYENNANATIKSLDELVDSNKKILSKDISYVVFHEAYQYFEKRFGVIPAGALTLNPDVLPGAKQIADIQDVINDKGIKCIFSEPQYNPKMIETLGNDMNISTGVMDPLGAYIDAGPSMYSELINGIANSIKDCH